MSQNIEAIVIGGSAGALDALAKLLPALPEKFPAAVVVVLHILPGKPSHLAQVLANRCALPVSEALDKEPLQPGHVYVASPDYHLMVEKSGCFSQSVDPAVNFSRPSIDVLFESAADAFADRVAGVLLTGGNDDGARGLERIGKAGGITVVQEPGDSQVPAMPESALKRLTPTKVLSSADIGTYLASLGAPHE